nr:transposase [Aromatoleum diolicum]
MIQTARQIADIDCAQEWVADLRCGALLADKGYDANSLVETIEASGAQAVIPPRSNRITLASTIRGGSARLTPMSAQRRTTVWVLAEREIPVSCRRWRPATFA